MTRDEIIRMALEAGYDLSKDRFAKECSTSELFTKLAESAYAAGAAAEREACAMLADKQMPVPEEEAPNHWEAYRKMWSLRAMVATAIAEAIRARGEKGQS